MSSVLSVVFSMGIISAYASRVDVGQVAPDFTLMDQDGKQFKLEDRRGRWTVLYFYPKSETPGCTKQACTYRDKIDQITSLNTEVFGISINTVKDQKDFQNHHKLNFTLLADNAGAVSKLYGTKMPLLPVSKRMTFILGPDLVIRSISKNVDPVKDVDEVAKKIKTFQAR